MADKNLFHYSLDHLRGKKALITGASSGIGEMTSMALAQEGVELFLTARREERLKKLKKDIQEIFPELPVTFIAGDLREEKTFQKLKEKKALEVDILVNNAGLVRGLDPVIQGNLTEWNEMVEVNIRSAFRVVREALPFMQEKKSGDIIFLASIAGHLAYEGGSVYCATKAALRAFATALRYEMTGKNIRSLIVSPGMVETEFSVVRFRGDEAKAKQVYQNITPLTSQDVAYQIVHALKMPRHVSLDEILVMSSDQAGTKKVPKT